MNKIKKVVNDSTTNKFQYNLSKNVSNKLRVILNITS